jgi:hypothetical protein
MRTVKFNPVVWLEPCSSAWQHSRDAVADVTQTMQPVSSCGEAFQLETGADTLIQLTIHRRIR